MIDITTTFTSKLEIDSVLETRPDISSNSNEGIAQDISISDAGYLFSIELNRQKIKNELKGLYELKHKNQEVDFLSSNLKILSLLPSLGEFLKKTFGEGTILYLDLLNEENNWETLFINVHTKEIQDWEFVNDFLNSFFENMFELFPSIVEKLNIDIISDAV
jgi:hypothetical protein